MYVLFQAKKKNQKEKKKKKKVRQFKNYGNFNKHVLILLNYYSFSVGEVESITSESEPEEQEDTIVQVSEIQLDQKRRYK